MAADTVYSVPDQYAGKSIKQLAQGGFDPNVIMSGEELARQLGVGWDAPLNAGQTFTTDWNDTGHGDYSLLKYFTQTPAADYYAKQQLDAQNKAIAPAVSSLQSGIPLIQQAGETSATGIKNQMTNVEQRYQALLDSLTGKEKQSEADVGLATSREFGKRGVPLSSGIYDQALLEKYLPLRSEWGDKYRQLGTARESDLLSLSQTLAMNPIQTAQQIQDVKNAIAAMQAGAGKDAITNALTMLQNSQELSFKERELAQNKELKLKELEDQWG